MKILKPLFVCLTFILLAYSSIIEAESPKVAIMYSDQFLLHDTGPNHPENADRLISVVTDLKNNLKLSPFVYWPNFKPATYEELNLVHSKEYIKLVDRQVGRLKKSQIAYLSTGDTAISKNSNDVAKLAVGAGIKAADLIMAKKASSAFALVRPPGHHATSEKGMGFCIYNNVAIVARYLQEKYGLKNILIVDFDVHHGNGTQDIFYDDDSVFYFSVHQHPFYPQSGRPSEIGSGKGKGFTLNVDLLKGSGDRELIDAFTEKLQPAMEDFKPEFILISAGFDAHQGDLLGQLNYTYKGYKNIAEILNRIAKKYASERELYILEGGYVPKNISNSVAEIIDVLKSSNMGD
tara:strand:+ start:140 stop:1186 length:1047 start_codon:yes stop_codon:yes gene_type:complete